MTLRIATFCFYAESRCAECHVLGIVMLNVIMLSVIVLSVVAPYLEALKFYLIKLATDFFDKQPIDLVSSSKIKLFYTLQKNFILGKPCQRGSRSTVDLLVPTGLAQLVLIMQTVFSY